MPSFSLFLIKCLGTLPKVGTCGSHVTLCPNAGDDWVRRVRREGESRSSCPHRGQGSDSRHSTALLPQAHIWGCHSNIWYRLGCIVFHRHFARCKLNPADTNPHSSEVRLKVLILLLDITKVLQWQQFAHRVRLMGCYIAYNI